MKTSVLSARWSMLSLTPDAMKSSVPRAVMASPMPHARMSTSVVASSCLMPSIHVSSLSACDRRNQKVISKFCLFGMKQDGAADAARQGEHKCFGCNCKLLDARDCKCPRALQTNILESDR